MEMLFNQEFTNNLWLILAPILFICGDVITGFLSALINKNLKSSKMREGLYRKFIEVTILGLGYVLDKSFNFGYITKFISIYIIIMETLSIYENVTKAKIDTSLLTKKIKEKENKNNEVK